MEQKKRILLCEFQQETDTFNPIVQTLSAFEAQRYAEGQAGYDRCQLSPSAPHGAIKAIEEEGGVIVPSVFLFTLAGGRVSDEVTEILYNGIKRTVDQEGPFDAVCAILHGATCTESEDDACGAFLTYLRELLGEEIPIAATFDLHGNITDTIAQKADVICGYQTYPHVDIYDTGYRTGKLCMRLLRGEPTFTATVRLPMIVPPVGYSSRTEPLKGVMEAAHALVESGELLDFSIFSVQPWMDIPDLASTAVAIAKDRETAKRLARQLGQLFFEKRDGYWPDLCPLEEALDMAESNDTPPFILVDAADSPNAGAVGDSVAVAMGLLERGSKLRAGMFVKDPEAVAEAFRLGVGGRATFTVGAKFTANVPGPIRAEGLVRSLHDGYVRREGPVEKGLEFSVGRAAVISFGNMDVLVCENPSAPGDPQLFRHFGIEPKLYDLIVVKANASFLVPYSQFAGKICYADTPGASAANLKGFHWERLPKGLYPFDLPEDYQVGEANIWRA